MKEFMPLNILFVLAVCTVGLTVFYNISLRENFALTVGYTLPDISQPAQEILSKPDTLYSDEPQPDESFEYDDYFEDNKETIILVTFPLEINAATMDELMYIPQVGSVMAQRIVQYREHLSGFSDIEQLRDISGIGEKTFDVISQYLYIESENSSE